MKKILGLLLLIGIVSCTTSEITTPEKIGMPNPASKYCVDEGGEIIMRKDAAGNVSGICRLKTGQEIEEWEYFRANN